MGKVTKVNPQNKRSKKNKNKYKSTFSTENKNFQQIKLGDIEAERDDNLASYFISSSLYNKIKDNKDSASIIIGEKGVGKSAILKKISLDFDNDMVLNISNNDLGILGMQNNLKEYLSDGSFKERRLAFKFLWLFIICATILQNYYKSKNWVNRGATKLFDEDFKELNAFFNIDKSDTPIKFTLTAAGKFLHPSMPIECDVKGKITNNVSKDLEKANELNNIMQTMSKFIANLDKYIPTERIFLLIDDLDSSWNNSDFAKLYTEGLVQAIFSINKKSKLKVVATFLESVFNAIELPNRDKIADNYAKTIRWDIDSCEKLILKRLEFNNLKLNNIFTNDINFAYIYKYTTGTPRDVIKFFQNCVDIYNDKGQRINKAQLDIIINDFSELKLQELISQIKEYYICDISPIINGLKGGKKMYPYKEFADKLNKICQLYDCSQISDHRIKNVLNYQGENIKGLIDFLYRQGFIGYSTHSSTKIGIYFNEDPGHEINENFHYIIRPTYVSKMSIK